MDRSKLSFVMILFNIHFTIDMQTVVIVYDVSGSDSSTSQHILVSGLLWGHIHSVCTPMCGGVNKPALGKKQGRFQNKPSDG